MMKERKPDRDGYNAKVLATFVPTLFLIPIPSPRSSPIPCPRAQRPTGFHWKPGMGSVAVEDAAYFWRDGWPLGEGMHGVGDSTGTGVVSEVMLISLMAEGMGLITRRYAEHPSGILSAAGGDLFNSLRYSIHGTVCLFSAGVCLFWLAVCLF